MRLNILFVFFSFSAFSQNITNSLNGYYVNANENDLYSSFYFDGKGHAIINDAFQAEYFQKDNKLFVFPDKSVFILKVDQNKLKGESSWVKKSTFKKSTVPTFEELVLFASNIVDAKLLYEYYKLNFTDGTDEINFSLFENEEDYLEKTTQLCNQGLTAACGAQFGIMYMHAMGGFKNLLGDGDTNQQYSFKENTELESLAKKIISLGDIKGYSLLGSYYYAIGNEEKAMETYQQGLEQGDQNSAAIILETELQKMIDEEVETEMK